MKKLCLNHLTVHLNKQTIKPKRYTLKIYNKSIYFSDCKQPFHIKAIFYVINHINYANKIKHHIPLIIITYELCYTTQNNCDVFVLFLLICTVRLQEQRVSCLSPLPSASVQCLHSDASVSLSRLVTYIPKKRIERADSSVLKT